jgi:hypothetical protein
MLRLLDRVLENSGEVNSRSPFLEEATVKDE